MTTETITYESVADRADIDPEAFTAYCDNQHIAPEDSEDAVNDFMDAYMGEWEDEEDFTRDYYEEDGTLMGLPSVIISHIDWQGVWDSDLRHEFYEINGYYFRNI